jgi:hypothetical protein
MSQPKEAKPTDLEAQRAVEEQLSFVMVHPGMSAWLKNALSSALERHPIEVLNDLEILNLILRNRSNLLIAENNSKGLRPDDL